MTFGNNLGPTRSSGSNIDQVSRLLRPRPNSCETNAVAADDRFRWDARILYSVLLWAPLDRVAQSACGKYPSKYLDVVRCIVIYVGGAACSSVVDSSRAYWDRVVFTGRRSATGGVRTAHVFCRGLPFSRFSTLYSRRNTFILISSGRRIFFIFFFCIFAGKRDIRRTIGRRRYIRFGWLPGFGSTIAKTVNYSSTSLVTAGYFDSRYSGVKIINAFDVIIRPYLYWCIYRCICFEVRS